MSRRLRLGLACLTLLTLGSARADLDLSGRTLTQRDEGKVVWQRTFPASMGNLTAPLAVGERTYIGAGPAVYALGSQGQVLGRADLPGVVTSLDAAGGAVRADTQGSDYTERFTLGEPQENMGMSTEERVVLPPLPAVTGWLARVADATPAGEVPRLTREFPSNPFLLLRLSQAQVRAGDQYGALSSVRQSLMSPLTFPAWTQLAVRLDTLGYPGAADLALERAKHDAAQRGLDPEIPVSRAALSAYGNPSGYVGSLLAQNRLDRAAVWMGFLRELYPQFEGHDALYHRYADLLEAQGRVGEAEEWRQFSRSLRSGSLYNLGETDTDLIRKVARLSTLTLLLVLLSALLVLGARAWRVQGQDTRVLGGRWGSLWKSPLSRARLSLVSYASFAERLMLAVFALGLLTVLAGWQWTNQTGQGLQSPALNFGTYGGGWYSAGLDDLNLRPGPDTAVMNGLAAQLDDDDTTARQDYTDAGQDACALNNLGVLSHGHDDEPQALELYRAALALRPDLDAAQYNLGLNPNTPGSLFQHTYRKGQPRLCYPDRRNVARMVSGDLSVTLRRDLSHPLDFLQSDRAGSRAMLRGHALGWARVAALVLLAVLLFLLLVPRAAAESRLGRPPLYRLLATLLPGSALLSSPWGAMLLLVWSAALVLLVPLLLPQSAGHLSWALAPVRDLRLDWTQLSWTQPAAVRNVLVLALVLVYALNILALSWAEARYFQQRRQERAALK